jgi:hypothetical protein
MMWKSKDSVKLKISNRFAALENLGDGGDDVDISRAWKSTGEYIKLQSEGI